LDAKPLPPFLILPPLTFPFSSLNSFSPDLYSFQILGLCSFYFYYYQLYYQGWLVVGLGIFNFMIVVSVFGSLCFALPLHLLCLPWAACFICCWFSLPSQ
jgi:hypothetical protein